MKLTALFVPLLFCTTLAASASADIPPGPGPGPECTAQSVARPGDQCIDCRGSYEQPNKCQELGAQGYQQACRAPGASVWNEVWCRGGGGPQPEQRRGCGSCNVGEERTTSFAALGLLALGALAFASRRR
ncbi:MAG: hypothetical protein IPI67_34180 [Myxococcales bacterium]|nr:hypothetical protein [Myxococcales bacterium]